MTEVVANDLVLLGGPARWWRWRLRRQFARIVVLVLGGRQQLRPERAEPEHVRRAVLRSRMRIFVLRERIEHTTLASRTCVPCRGGVPPLKGKTSPTSSSTGGAGALEYRRTASHRAQLQFPISSRSCVRESSGRAGRGAGASIPTSCWDGARSKSLWTHAVDGLTESDFILAAKIDQLS